MAIAAVALALHMAAGFVAPVRVASRSLQVAQAAPPEPAARPLWPTAEPSAPAPPRGEFAAAFLLALGEPLTPGLALRGRVRLVAGLWAHAGVSARAGSAPVAGGVREIPFELGLGYRVALGQYFTLGVRGEALLISRRMAVQNAEARHRWLGGLRGGVEARVKLNEDFGLILFAGAEGRLGRTEVNVPGVGSAAFSPVAPYFELGPSISF